MKFFQGIFVVGVLILGGGYFYHKTTPEYTLKQIKQAIEDKNKRELMKYIDLSSIKLAIVADYMQQLSEDERLASEGRVSSSLNTLVDMAFNSYFIPEKLLQQRGYAQSNSHFELSDFDKVSCNDRVCRIEVTVLHKTKKETRKIMVTMSKRQGEWKLIAIAGLAREIKKVIQL